uniref:SMC hinge domain-containing protein n=2 Tax=Rhodosorus marinus TaxID=101924 RepID=A0A7S3A4B0_9RHOD|mmetsp:Transcript_4294/g.18309  ORF Transcript_4294/g.18309 Transcript_4294/m.18309 type:complete len:1158 (+) Transcript_4294:105-3578(+)
MVDSDVEELGKRRPRLMIQALRLENFKSYGGVVNVGPFHKNFSAIVGPNGSGKSNVIDAMLFVFGKRAKQMRLNKIAELIHNSESKRPADSASVTVFLQEIIDNGDADYEVVEGSQIEITRTVFKNSTSKYLVNQETSSFSNVQQLLGAKGVDLDNNRFLILQGEVEQISLMKPKAPNPHEDGLVDYLEDIIGTRHYVEHIDRTAQEVEDANEERSLKLTRVRAAEKERDALESAKDEAEEYLRMELDLVRKKLLMYRFREHEVQRSQEEVQRKAEHYSNKLQDQKVMKERIEVELAADVKILERNQSEHDEVAYEVNKCKEEFSAFERRDISHRENMKHLKAKSKKLNSSLEKERRKIVEQKALAEKYTEDREIQLEEQQVAHRDLNKAEEALTKEFDRVKQSTSPLRLKIEQKQEQLTPFLSAKNERVKELEIMRSQLKILEETIAGPERELEKVQEDLKKARRELEDLNQNQASAHERDLKAAKQRKAELEYSLSKGNENVARLTTEIQALRRQIQISQEALKSNAQSNRAEVGLMKAAHQGRLLGVVGRLSELATVDDKYDTAVGAAAGSSLQNIVVETPEDAQACVEFLRNHNLGRATFIILNKLQYLRKDMEKSVPATNRRLFDMLQIEEEKNKVAFYYALRDTLVAENMDEATKLAYQPSRRNRVVTVAGQLIESSGAMTGGGGKVPKANLGSKVRAHVTKDESRELESKLKQAMEDLSRAREQNSSLHVELKQTNESISSLEVEMQKCAMDAKILKNLIQDLKHQVPKIQKAAEMTRSSKEHVKYNVLLKETEAKEILVEEASEPCIKLEAEISVLEEQLLAVGGPALEKAKERKETASKCFEEVSSMVNKFSLMIESARKAHEKASKSSEEHELELNQIQEELKQKREEFGTIEEQAIQVKSKLEKAEDVLADKAASLEVLQNKNAELLKAVSEVKSAELDLKHKIDDLTKTGKELEGKANHWRKKIKEMRASLRKVGAEAEGLSSSDGDVDMSPNSGETGEDVDVEDAMEIDSEDEDLDTVVYEDLNAAIEELEKELESMKPNLGAIGDYKKKDMECSNQMGELDGITSRRDDARKAHEEMRQKRHEEFAAGFKIIAMKLKEMYQMITLGGDAELVGCSGQTFSIYCKYVSKSRTTSLVRCDVSGVR